MKRAVVLGGIVWAIAMLATGVNAADPGIFKVEEDWEMQVNQPEPNSCSPQVTFFMSPSTANSSTYFQLQMNYFAAEAFSSGGFHVAAVHHGSTVDEARSATQNPLSVDGDTIRWTNVMAALDGQLLFAVKNGYSAEWGSFGGPEYLVAMPDEGVGLLETYNHLQSEEAVDIGFGGNRVASVKLKQVRIYYSDGRVQKIVTQ